MIPPFAVEYSGNGLKRTKLGLKYPGSSGTTVLCMGLKRTKLGLKFMIRHKKGNGPRGLKRTKLGLK